MSAKKKKKKKHQEQEHIISEKNSLKEFFNRFSDYHFSITFILKVSCITLFIKLIFSGRGLIDYYEMNQVILAQQEEIKLLEIEYQQYHSEIERLRKDKKYQKQIVKRELGVLGKDEYLLIFR